MCLGVGLIELGILITITVEDIIDSEILVGLSVETGASVETRGSMLPDGVKVGGLVAMMGKK